MSRNALASGWNGKTGGYRLSADSAIKARFLSVLRRFGEIFTPRVPIPTKGT
jgi:hypothetical protein